MRQRSPKQGHQTRLLHLVAVCAVVTGLFAFLQLSQPSKINAPLRDTENYVEDLFLRHAAYAPVDPRLVLVGIDRPTYADDIFPEDAKSDPVLGALRERFPWSRRVWAALIERLGNAGAQAIVLDLVFGAENDGDVELRAALEKFGDRVVIGSNLSPVETDRGTLSQLLPPSTSLLPAKNYETTALDHRVGYVNIWPDDDGIFRRARFRATNHELGDVVNGPPNLVLESLDARLLSKLPQPKFRGSLPAFARIRFVGPPGTVFEMPSVGDVLTPKLWAANYKSGEFFKGKIVLIGPTANLFQDYHRTPFGHDMVGPEIHLNIINAGLSDRFVRESSNRLSALTLVIAGLLAGMLCQFVKQPLKRLAAIVILSVLGFAGAWALFNYHDLFVPSVAPLGVLLVSGVASLGYDFILERLEKIKLRHTMGLYFSPRVLEAVLADPGSMEPRRAEVVMLLTDLRNSTPLAELLGPHGTFALLNQVFEVQTSAIMGEEGNLEHFLGDQFLSYWGAPQAQPGAADRAERAAIKLIEAMEKLQATLPPAVQKLFGYGVALHSGTVLVGNKGSALRLDYGLVGDAVNEAARIEALTKHYGVKLLLSRPAYAQLSRQGPRRLIDRVIVKGKSEPVELFECQHPRTPPNYESLCQEYKTAYDEYFFGRFEPAARHFESLVTKYNDGPSRTLTVRCRLLMNQPPPDWKGVWLMDSK
jgi:adenylate cyclase